jgi:hypothetical protein
MLRCIKRDMLLKKKYKQMSRKKRLFLDLDYTGICE